MPMHLTFGRRYRSGIRSMQSKTLHARLWSKDGSEMKEIIYIFLLVAFVAVVAIEWKLIKEYGFGNPSARSLILEGISLLAAILFLMAAVCFICR